MITIGRKIVGIILFIAILCGVGYGVYTLLFRPPTVTLLTYKRIERGMSDLQVGSQLRPGWLYGSFRDISTNMEPNMEKRKGVKWGDILNECRSGSIGIQENLNYGMRNRPSYLSISDEIVSKEGTFNPDGSFVPAKKVKMGGSVYSSFSGTKSDWFELYEFHECMETMTVDNKRYKVIRNGVVGFPNPPGWFDSWKGRDGRVITVLFTQENKVSYWSYQGPAEDFIQ